MSGADYLHCAACGAKALYDADVNYDYPNLGALVALCKECRKTHTLKPTRAVPVPESIRATAIETALKADIPYAFIASDGYTSVATYGRSELVGALVDAVLPAVVAQVQADSDENDAKYFHDGWVAALREIRLLGDRKVGEFLVEQLGEATDE